jgi:hypothetical protein
MRFPDHVASDGLLAFTLVFLVCLLCRYPTPQGRKSAQSLTSFAWRRLRHHTSRAKSTLLCQTGSLVRRRNGSIALERLVEALMEPGGRAARWRATEAIRKAAHTV